jgi:hypothetical protein
MILVASLLSGGQPRPASECVLECPTHPLASLPVSLRVRVNSMIDSDFAQPGSLRRVGLRSSEQVEIMAMVTSRPTQNNRVQFSAFLTLYYLIIVI